MGEVQLKHGIWVVVADGEKALFLRNEGDAKFPNLQVVRRVEQDNPATHEQGSDRPGRFSDGPNVHRSAVDDTDWHRLGKERFADEIARRLYAMVTKGEFEDIILVAPPLVLGEMRRKLHKMVADRVRWEVPKTLTNHPVWEIETLLNAA